MRRLRIVHLRSAEFFGGPERAIIGQCKSLLDFDFLCAAFQRGSAADPFVSAAQAAELSVSVIKDSFPGDFRATKSLRHVLDEFDADILVSHDYKANIYGRCAIGGTRIKQIAHFRGYTTEDTKVRLYNRINTWFLQRAETILTVSEGSKRVLIDLGVQPQNIHVVPNAIEDHKFVPREYRKQVRESGPIRVVCAGRLSHEKGYDVLLRAIALLKNVVPVFKVDVYGHGPEERSLRTMIADFDLQASVELRGFVDDILPVLRASDLLVLPSRSEGMPNILLEAWSQKLGVVATAVGGVPEMLTDGENGLLSEPDRPRELAAKLKEALLDTHRNVMYGEAGYRLTRQRYGYDRQATVLTEIYRGVASR